MVGVFAGFGAGQAERGGQHIEGGVRFQVIENEKKLLLWADQHPFMPPASLAMPRPLRGKTRIRFLLAPFGKRLGQGTKRGPIYPRQRPPLPVI